MHRTMPGQAIHRYCTYHPTPQGLVDFLATLALTSGAIFIITALFTLGRNLSPLLQPRKKHSLVVSGIYSYVRHPMYGGLMLVAAGRSGTAIMRVGVYVAVCQSSLLGHHGVDLYAAAAAACCGFLHCGCICTCVL